VKTETAQVLLSAIRASGAVLMNALVEVRPDMRPDEFEAWSKAVGRTLGKIQDELLDPLLEEHPSITPTSLGGSAD
jgi:hypothetical protein